ncbi:MAG: hypothetical protein GXP29_12985 [Planctomycetes bacterium]|nr:hypothetical protein [Planctomycetota bacterium]
MTAHPDSANLRMPQLERISQRSPIFVKNIEALQPLQPELAKRLEASTIPDSMQSTIGRDGSPVVVLGADANRVEWLGGSSMPSISVPAALSGFVDHGSNVALPSVGTGYECAHLLKRLLPHEAVFVCEANTERLAAALCVVDLAAQLAGGRLIFLDGDIEASLPDFIEHHPGYDFPTQLFALPDLTPAAFKARTAALHRACQAAGARQLKHTGRMMEIIKRGAETKRNKPPHVAILSVDAAGGSVEHAARIQRAVKALGWSCSVSVPDHPKNCSAVSRVRTLAKKTPDFVLCLNGAPSILANHLPSAVATAAWFLDTATLPAVSFEGSAKGDHLIAASEAVREAMIARGAPRDCIRVIETGVDHLLFGKEAEPSRRSNAILVLVDGEDINPRASGIGLESHERLWAEVQQSIEAAADRDKSMDLSAILLRAERDTGIRLNEDSLRSQFLSIVSTKMVKTIIARTAIESVSKGALEITLLGKSWASHQTVAPILKGEIPPADQRYAQYASHGCVVLPFADASAIQFCLEAIVAGCLPVIRRSDGALFEQYPTTRSILKDVPQYGTNTQLLAETRKWSAHPSERDQRVAELRSRVLASHKTTDRLTELKTLLCD